MAVNDNLQLNESEKEIEQRKYFASYLRMLKDVHDREEKLTDVEGFKEFVRRVVEENPYVIFSGEINTIAVSKLKETERGMANRNEKSLQINENLMGEVLNSLYFTLKTIGHEKGHLEQAFRVNKLIEEGIADREEERQIRLNQFYEDFKSFYLTPESFDEVINLMGAKLGPVFDAYKKLPENEQNIYCQASAQSHYLCLLSEGLAERQGFDFSDHMIESWLEDEFVDDDVKQWLAQQYKISKIHREVDPFVEQKKIDLLKHVEKTMLQDMSQEEIVSMVNELARKKSKVLFANATEGTTDLKKTLSTVQIAQDFIMRTISKNVSKKTVESLVLTSLALGNSAFSDFKNTYDGRLDTTKEDINSLELSVGDALVNGDLPIGAYKVCYFSCLNQDVIYNILNSLLENGQLLKAIKFRMLNKNDFLQDIDEEREAQIDEAMQKTKNNYIARIKSGEKISRVEFNEMKAEFFEELNELYVNGEVNFMSDEEELEYYQNNRGNSLIPYIKNEQKLSKMSIFERYNLNGLEYGDED